MDFYRINLIEKKDGSLQVRPDWRNSRSEDLMTRGGAFYAVWDEERGLWSTDIYDVQRLVDADLVRYAKEYEAKSGLTCSVARLESNSTKLWAEFQNFIRNSGNSSHNLDEKLIFANTEVKKKDYASKRLPYSLEKGKHDAWDTLLSTLYNEEERAKIEWAIGAVISGDSKSIQKFLVFYGPPGSGKSTILNIIQKLFEGYVGVFDARELAGNNNAFATAAFKSNPLVAIQHDGDLSKIYDNTKLNSIVAHEIMTVNEKYKTPFTSRSNAFLFMGTNVPVKITDAKSGIIRRLIDVVPTQQTIEIETYHALMHKIDFELGAIAQHCLDRYISMGKNYYNAYRPVEMMLQTDVFYNFIEHFFDVFKEEDGVSLTRAWTLYKEYCLESGIEKILPKYKLREELKNYFTDFEERTKINGEVVRSYYRGFKHLSPSSAFPIKPDGVYEIVLENRPSIFDEKYPGLPAQYANRYEVPAKPWSEVTTTLRDLDTSKLHYVKIPEEHIVIDFDLVDENGNKSLARNLEEASRWPPTYTELSKSGKGVHLHYIYTGGDVSELASVYDVGIEIKTLLGDQSLRRKLTKSNNMNITYIGNNGNLPKKEKKVLDDKVVQSEKHLRARIAKCLRKEHHGSTKPEVDFIKQILDEAYESGMAYDVTDMRSNILTFAAKSTNQSTQSIKTVQQMKFVGQAEATEIKDEDQTPLVFFDVEVYPNLLVVCWKKEGKPGDPQNRRGSDSVVRMINPEPRDIEPLFSMKLVGFNNRRYDNHILFARFMGYSIQDVYNLSQKMIVEKNARDYYFGKAYDISYADIYDFSSKKQGLKRFMIELGIHHMELDIPWDQPVDKELWDKVVEYCVNDVVATEAVFNDRKQDFVARQILAELSGMSVNNTTQQHTAKIIFGDEKNPQKVFTYTDLSEEFPGYYYGSITDPDTGNTRWGSLYRDENPGEGGYVYAEPGIYENVALLDVASMHPTTIEVLNLFGPYTGRYSELKEARMAIKRKDYETAKHLLDGKLGKFLGDDEDAEALSYALKIVINIVYGLTSAKFPNAFRDGRNKDNIVAKRGALFMIDLKHEVQDRGFAVAHIKTDSIKIPNATPEIINFVINYGKEFGYDFEHETTYDWFCLVNDAVYIAKAGEKWTAVGAQFQHPYVFKTLFTQEPLVFDDFCEMKNVTQGTMYIDFGATTGESGNVADMMHVGRTGSFVPVIDNGARNVGGALVRVKDDKIFAVTGTKGYLWITREMAIERQKDGTLEIDMQYFEKLKQEAIDAMTQFDEVNGLKAIDALNLTW